MHIIIGFLTALAGLIWALYALQNSGVDLNSFNPFSWARRRKWKRLYGTKAIYSLGRPLEAAAVLLTGLVKQEGDISREQKEAIIKIFEDEFHLEKQRAVDAFSSSVFLIKDEVNFDQSVKSILAPVKDAFTPEQSTSLLSLLNKVAVIEGEATEAQKRIIAAAEQELNRLQAPENGTWH